VKDPFEDALLAGEAQRITEKSILSNHRICLTERIFIIHLNCHIRNACCRVLSRGTCCSNVFD